MWFENVTVADIKKWLDLNNPGYQALNDAEIA